LLEPRFDPTVFTKNRRRLLRHAVAQQFFDEVVRQAAMLGLLSGEHLTVDGTLIEAAASLKSFRPKDGPPTSPPDDPGNPTVNFHGEGRCRRDELLEQSLSRFISTAELREFTAALRMVVDRGATRNAFMHPRSASGEVIPTTLNVSALRDPTGKVIGAIGILRDMRTYENVVRDLEESKAELQEKILDREKFEEVVVGRELKMIALKKEVEKLQRELNELRAESRR
jgi:PAS fold